MPVSCPQTNNRLKMLVAYKKKKKSKKKPLMAELVNIIAFMKIEHRKSKMAVVASIAHLPPFRIDEIVKAELQDQNKIPLQ